MGNTLGAVGSMDVRWVMRELLEEGRVDQENFNVIATTPRSQQERSWHVLEVVAKYRLTDQLDGELLDTEKLSHWLANKVELPYFTIDPLSVVVDQITGVMSYAFAEKHGLLALEVQRDQITLACEQPFNNNWQTGLQQVLGGRNIKRVFANPEQVRRYRMEFYNLSRSISGARDKSRQDASLGNFEQLLDLGGKTPDADNQHIVNIVDWILQYAFAQRASDIHLEPRRDIGKLRFRIDGVLHDVYQLPATIMAAITSRLKILSRLNVAEKRKPQDGRLKTRIDDNNEVELRISTLPTAFGEKMVLRIFDPEVLLRSFEQLGFTTQDLAAWHKMVKRPHGIVFVTGPTGSGKTTTLYSTLKDLSTSEVNVCTLEDPIEMIEPSFNQMQVQPQIGLGFTDGIKSILRQDPDIIMIGEIRELATAEMAIQAALTGHLVLSTLHTNDAPASITRLLDLGVPPYLITATVAGVMAQRLVRTLCPHCKKPGPVDNKVWQDLVYPFRMKTPETVYRPEGCLECRGTGYMGRIGLYETLHFDNAMKATINHKGDLDSITRRALKSGLTPLRISGAKKVMRGLTTIEEVMRVTPVQEVLLTTD